MRYSPWSWIAVGLCVLASAAPVRAQQAEAWYGWQTLSADAAAVLSMVAGATLPHDDELRRVLTCTGVGLYTFGAPVAHVAHGRWGYGLGSLGMRLVPLALTPLTFLACPFHPFGGQDDTATCPAFAAVWVATTIVPVVLDTSLFAHDHEPAHADSMAIAPWVGRQSGGLVLQRAF